MQITQNQNIQTGLYRNRREYNVCFARNDQKQADKTELKNPPGQLPNGPRCYAFPHTEMWKYIGM